MPISGFNSPVSDIRSHPGYVSGAYYICQNRFVSDGTSQNVWVPNAISYSPFEILEDITVSRVGVYCSNPKTSANGIFGWYTNENGRPKQLLFSSGDISFQVAGFKEVIVNISVSKGWYWKAGISSVAPFLSTISDYMGNNSIIGQVSPSVSISNALIRHTQATAFTSLPDVAPLGNISYISGAVSPIIWIKIA